MKIKYIWLECTIKGEDLQNLNRIVEAAENLPKSLTEEELLMAKELVKEPNSYERDLYICNKGTSLICKVTDMYCRCGRGINYEFKEGKLERIDP